MIKTFNLEDIVQICLGSTLLATPIVFTEEAWSMSQNLPMPKLLMILATSLFLNACTIYYGVYEGKIINKAPRFFSRIIFNYLLTSLTVFYLLFLLNLLPPLAQYEIWIPKIILISFPASLGGAVLDSFDKE